MSQVYGLPNEPKNAEEGGFWKNLAGKLNLPFEKYASANKAKAGLDASQRLASGSFTPIGVVKPRELRLVAGGTEITVKTSATQKKELEGMFNKIISSLAYMGDTLTKSGVQITQEDKVRDIKSYIDASEAIKRAKAKIKDAETAMGSLEPKLMEYFKASDAEVKILEIEAGFIQLSEKPVGAVPSYKNVVEEVKKKLTDFSDLIDGLVKKYTPSGTKEFIDVHPRQGNSMLRMRRVAISPKEADDVRDTINEAVNDLKIANNLIQFLLDESVSAEIPGQPMEAPMPGMDTPPDVNPEMNPEMNPGMSDGVMPEEALVPMSPAPMLASQKYSLFKKADGLCPKCEGNGKVMDDGINHCDACGGTGEVGVGGQAGKYEVFYSDGTSEVLDLTEPELDSINEDIGNGIVKTVYIGKTAMKKRADGTQGTWDIENYKNVDRCRDCAFFQSDPGGSHLNKCHDCVHYKLGGTIDYFTPRSGQIVTQTPTYKTPDTDKKAFVGTIGMPRKANTGDDKLARKLLGEEEIKKHENGTCRCDLTNGGYGLCMAGQWLEGVTTSEDVIGELGESQPESLPRREGAKKPKVDVIKTQDTSLEDKVSFKGTIGMPRKAEDVPHEVAGTCPACGKRNTLLVTNEEKEYDADFVCDRCGVSSHFSEYDTDVIELEGMAVKADVDSLPKPVTSNAEEKEIQMGIEVEKEHQGTLEEIERDALEGHLEPMEHYLRDIAEDHVKKEISDYYTRLKKMEEEAKQGF